MIFSSDKYTHEIHSHVIVNNHSIMDLRTSRISAVINRNFTPASSNWSDHEVDNYIELIGQEFESYVISPWAWSQLELAQPVYLYILPILACIVLLTNTTVIWIFVKENMLSSVNIILIAIAISDTLTVFCPSPFLIIMYSDGKAPSYVPYDWCRIWDYISKYIPTITNTASNWLAAVLAGHRYACVCHPFEARRLCSPRASVLSIIIVYVASILCHLCRFVDSDYLSVELIVENKTVSTCAAIHVEFLHGFELQYECIYYWIYVTVVQFVPFVMLLVLSVLMIRGMKKSETLHFKFTPVSRDSSKKQKRQESHRLTKMIVAILVIVVLAELPIMIVIIIWTLNMVHKKITIDEESLGNVSVALNLINYICYPSIFLIYCSMSRQFRKALKNCLMCKRAKADSLVRS